jgi:hypothetical protein
VKNKSRFVLFVMAVLYCIFFFNSCRKSDNTKLWEVDALVPLFKSAFSINHIITDSLLVKNASNAYDVVYKSSLYSFSMIAIPDTSIDTLFFSPFQWVVDSCDVIIPGGVDETTFKIQPLQLSQAIIHSGKMQIRIENNSRKILDIRYQIPSATLNSKNFDITITVPAKSGTVPGKISADYDLSGYALNLTGKNKVSVNTFVSSIGVKINCNDTKKDTIFPFSDYVKIANSFINIIPSYAKGYFGKSMQSLSDTINLPLFNHITAGMLSVEDMKANLSIENSMGVDARFTINTLESINDKTTLALTSSLIGVPKNINRALDNNGIVTLSTYTTTFTTANSSIKPFFENRPNQIGFKMNLEMNPLGNISGGNDFFYKDKSIKSSLTITFPLSVVANGLTMIDTFNFSMPYERITNINSGKIYLYAHNGFPFSAQAQLFLMDNNATVIDSLVSLPNTLAAAPLDINHIAIGKQKSKLILPINESKIGNLKKCKKIGVKIIFTTAGAPSYIKIYDHYQLAIQIVGDFNYSIEKKK